jgi:ribonucleoside-diphosphate reductase alpha chain
MALQYGVPLITLVDKFRHARFEPSGMTSNRDIPFAKSLIDYIFCWLGCQFIPGYADKNTPNRAPAAENKNTTTAREVVEKTKDLAKKIAEVKAEVKVKPDAINKKAAPSASKQTKKPVPQSLTDRISNPVNRVTNLVSSVVTEESDAKIMQQFSSQFAHFPDDAPACDICGSITVRNGTCYKCYNCGNSMGCS